MFNCVFHVYISVNKFLKGLKLNFCYLRPIVVFTLFFQFICFQKKGTSQFWLSFLINYIRIRLERYFLNFISLSIKIGIIYSFYNEIQWVRTDWIRKQKQTLSYEVKVKMVRFLFSGILVSVCTDRNMQQVLVNLFSKCGLKLKPQWFESHWRQIFYVLCISRF